MSTMTKDEINVSLFDEVKKLQIENLDLKGDCEHFTQRIKEMVAREMELESQVILLAKLAADTPKFFNLLEAMAAKKLRDDILSNIEDQAPAE